MVNSVSFDAGKEEFTVTHHIKGQGEDFRLLGLVFDTKLLMHTAVQTLVGRARPKTQALLKTRRFYNTWDVVIQFKTHVLCVLESATAAVYHAADGVLAPLDGVRESFLKELGVTQEQAFLQHNLAPYSFRRDVAMLVLLHKCSLGTSHPWIQELFRLVPKKNSYYRTKLSEERHDRQLMESCAGNFLEITRRSLFGLVRLYNFLFSTVVHLQTVKVFQGALTNLAKRRCEQ